MSNTSLYPPIVASSMPAFDVNSDGVKIYFQISKYNNYDEIQSVQFSLRRRDNNKNVLKKDHSEAAPRNKYYDESGKVTVSTIYYDEDKKMYYIVIKNSDLKNGKFEVNTVYKVQLRFSSVTRRTAGYESEDKERNTYYSYLINQTDKFSEWSSVCLIKPINPPEIGVVDIDDYGEWEDTWTPQKGHSSDGGWDNNNQNYYYNNLADFVFTYSQTNKKGKKSQQLLKQWKANLYKVLPDNSEELVAEKDWTSVINWQYQEIQDTYYLPCSLDYEFEHDNLYRIVFRIKTNSDYQDQCDYYFVAKLDMIDHWSKNSQDQKYYGDPQGTGSSLNTYINEQQGYVKIVFIEGANQKIRNLVLRRSNSKTNFQKWETIRTFAAIQTVDPSQFPNVHPSFTYYDFTIESGIAYRYLVQERNDKDYRLYTPLYDQFSRKEIDNNSHKYDPSRQYGIVGQWQHAFLLQTQGYGLIDQVKQLKLKYNFSLSSFAVNVIENKTDTLGSQYPFIKRNASVYYRSFPISGTIASSMDNARLFTSKESLNDGYSHIYDNFRGDINTGFSKQYDYTYERKFRQAVMEFLYDSKPKLFKTMQQGNILIRLMEVSLSPVEGLNRLVYNFSATAYEVGPTDIDTLEKWGIINTGIYNNEDEFTAAYYGQLHYYSEDGSDFKAYRGIIGLMSGEKKNQINIADQIGVGREKNDIEIIGFTIKWLRITIESDPYLIAYGIDPSPAVNNQVIQYHPVRNSSDILQPVSVDSNLPFYQMGKDGYYIGNVLRVFTGTMSSSDAQDILISPPNNIYEISQANQLDLDGSKFEIWPKKDSNLIVDYIIEAKVKPIVNMPLSKIRMSKKIGQFYGSYDYNYDFITIINNRYNNEVRKNNKIVGQEVLQRINSIVIQAQPGTVFELGMNGEVNDIIIDETGVLDLQPSGTNDVFESLKVAGYLIKNEQVSGVQQEICRYKIDNKLYRFSRVNSSWNFMYLYYNITDHKPVSIDVNIIYNVTTRREYYKL